MSADADPIPADGPDDRPPAPAVDGGVVDGVLGDGGVVGRGVEDGGVVAGGVGGGEVEEVDGVLVVGEGTGQIALRSQSSSMAAALTAPTVQAAAVAAGGFIAGAAVIGLVGRRRHPRRAGRGARASRRSVGRPKGAGEQLIQIVGSRSLLVDVHLLGGER